MQILHSNGNENKNGFIYVASRQRLYYELALISAQSLKDFSRKTHATLFTHSNFVDDRCKKVFDKVIVDIPIHYRSKMWCMARTPYERTIYNDCDSIIQHRDVEKMFDFLDECDLFCGGNLEYTVGNIKVAYIDIQRKHKVRYHGSMWGYHSTPLILDFMQTWFDEYIKQTTTPWQEPKVFYEDWKPFDMFTLWKLTCKRYPEFARFNDLNIKVLSRRWNNTGQDLPDDLDGPPVITQIDRTTWKRMPFVWDMIMKGANDANYSITKQKIDSSTFEYN